MPVSCPREQPRALTSACPGPPQPPRPPGCHSQAPPEKGQALRVLVLITPGLTVLRKDRRVTESPARPWSGRTLPNAPQTFTSEACEELQPLPAVPRGWALSSGPLGTTGAAGTFRSLSMICPRWSVSRLLLGGARPQKVLGSLQSRALALAAGRPQAWRTEFSARAGREPCP